jgi:hypothetical protein
MIKTIVVTTLMVTTFLVPSSSVLAQTKGIDSIRIMTVGTDERRGISDYGAGGTIWSDGSWQDNLPEGRVKVSKQLTPIADYFNQTAWAKYSMLTLDQQCNLDPLSMLGIKYGESFHSSKYNTKSLESLPQGVNKGATILDIVSNPRIQSQVNEAVKRAFPYTNPNTGKPDFTGNEWYAKYVGLGVASGMIGGRSIDAKLFFDGTAEVTRAEFLKMLYFCAAGRDGEYKYGDTLDKASIDGIVTKTDWYRQAYNYFVVTSASPLYGLYRKEELAKPITRAEMAYITARCWRLWGGIEANSNSKYRTGYFADWSKPEAYKNIFSDLQIDVETKYITSVVENETGVVGSSKRISSNLKDYLNGRSVSKVVSDTSVNKSSLPLPLYMSIFELNKRGIINGFGNGQVGALKTLTRAEALTVVFNISKTMGKYWGDALDN